jgi:hypothetical protein
MCYLLRIKELSQKITAFPQRNASLETALTNDKLVGKTFVGQGTSLGVSPTLPTWKAELALELFSSVCDRERVSGTLH